MSGFVEHKTAVNKSARKKKRLRNEPSFEEKSNKRSQN